MPKQLALILFTSFVLWLFVRDRKLRPMPSRASWIALLWIMIIGSRPISLWFDNNVQMDISDPYHLEGSAFDRNVYIFLIVAGLMILFTRRLNWSRIFASNRWLFMFFVFCGISVIWADLPFVSMKRWIKDVGHLVMVLIILTEKDPVQALRSVFMRYTYFALPMSILFIKYYPDIGRYYNRWTWEVSYAGVTLEKNTLGPVAVICGMFIVWEMIYARKVAGGKYDALDLLGRIVLLIMAIWLLGIAHSATAIICFVLGIGILVYMQLPSARRKMQHLGRLSIVLAFLLIIFYSSSGITEAIVQLVGRNMTLTGRTDIWEEVLREPINRFIGTGYQSFWFGVRAERMWEKYYFRPNQAHNGYLETYLNGGLVGLSLLMAMIVTASGKLKRDVLAGKNDGILLFALFVVVLFSNWTEATFNKMSLLWIILIITALLPPLTAMQKLKNTGSDTINDGAASVPRARFRTPVLSRKRIYF